MKLVVISDTHNKHDELSLPSGDVLIHCGDACTKGNYTEAKNFLWWFARQNFAHKIYVPGNHDRKMKISLELQQLAVDLGIQVLTNVGTRIGNVNFWGGTFTPYIKKGIYRQTLGEREEAWKDMPLNNVDVLITHAPPRGILDTNIGGDHCGCDVLLDRVLSLNPTVHVFGHIHEHMQETLYNGNTRFYNCSNSDRAYTLHPEYITINI